VTTSSFLECIRAEGTPALANILLLRKGKPIVRRWYLAGPLRSALYYCSTASPKRSMGSMAQMVPTVNGVTSNIAVQETGARDARPCS